ncbi:tRNA pseudouridine synthase B [Panacagrimonas perspica]|uniref:tRNA pseudouridine synthase B n=1 Tax=Panacagrimonas perspica TaxID=381431 RepID=A0A4S3KAG6_9GAMM|nr:tRNA pseudouridine(55) synthase TruB [Panacagrimonas perspica]TDU32385.1 tRNA pseudouridine synthase B [Panacagrimonas perspica]THD05316.1 tRNA pseudouridine(55) synthase TruB [Panacagrimonas perspica]
MARVPRRALDGILLLDKPLGLSSNTALQQARRLFQAEKAGHTGSLDPLATGMLPVCFGEATKLCGLLLDSDKSYVARMRLGSCTTTGDAEGQVTTTSDPSALTLEDFERVKLRFMGPIRQIPPMYSALKHEGRRLYELAREGEDVERAPREITIHSLEFGPIVDGELDVTVSCSKGTYIRTLVEDLAASLGQCAHLSGLRRTRVDPFGPLRIWNFEEMEALATAGLSELDAALLPMAAAVKNWSRVSLPPDTLRRFSRGQAVDCVDAADLSGETSLAVMDEAGLLKGVGKVGADGRLHPKRWLGGSSMA